MTETQPTGWLDGLDAAGQIGGVTVGSAQNPGDRIQNIDLHFGDEGQHYDFGELLPVSISGLVHFSDPSGDCFSEDIFHPPLADVRVVLFNSQGDPIAETRTNSQGAYSFTGLMPGTYKVVEHTPPRIARRR